MPEPNIAENLHADHSKPRQFPDQPVRGRRRRPAQRAPRARRRAAAGDDHHPDPAQAARRLAEGGFALHYETALQTLTDVPYNVWRELDAEDSLRFYALWLHEFGKIDSTPNQLIAEGTNWHFLNEIKRELKA